MATKLEKTLKREIEIDGKAYMVAISPEGVKVTQKGFRRGPELTWRSIISGEAEMGQQLKSSVSSTGGSEGSTHGLACGFMFICRFGLLCTSERCSWMMTHRPPRF